MFQPTDLVKCLIETFDKSARVAFQQFLARNPGSKWIISADYCLHDKSRPNNVFAFSIIPYDAYPDVLKAEISTALPKDLKKTKVISDAAADFLNHPRRFHIAFLSESKLHLFDNGPGSNPLAVARESVALMLKHVTDFDRGEDTIKSFKKMLQESKANSFNVELLTDMTFLTYLYAFVTLLIARERRLDVVGWFSDRDNMTTWCDGIVWHMATEGLYGIGDHFKVTLPSQRPVIAIPDPTSGNSGMWYDELIRLPDYIAGILAAWDIKSNKIPGDKDKYRQLAQGVIADSEHMAIFKLHFLKHTFSCSRLTFTSEPPTAVSDAVI